MSQRLVVRDAPIDWDELNEQKKALLTEISWQSERANAYESEEGPSAESVKEVRQHIEHLEGILSLIDALQDDAVDNLGIWKFPTKKFTMRHVEKRELVVEVEAVDEEEARQLMAEHVKQDAEEDWDILLKHTEILEMRED